MNEWSQSSVSQWIDQLRDADAQAAQKLWNRYIERLIRLARTKLKAIPRRVADEEDVALVVMNSVFSRAAAGQFPQLRDRDDLWRLLVTITDRRATDQIKHELRQKRGGGKVKGESALFFSDHSGNAAPLNEIDGREPTPEFAAMLAEELDILLNKLRDQSLREVALLKLKGFSNEEIATRMERTTRSIERKLQRIRIIFSAEEAV